MNSPIKKLLIANRGEIAIRIARTATELGVPTVAVYSKDDAQALHIQHADEAVELPGVGVSAYLTIDSVVDAALKTGCDAVHPGYGLLSENADFAQACTDQGLGFIGPDVDTLKGFGDKLSARSLARAAGIPVIEGTDQAKTAEDVVAFFQSQNNAALMLKAVNGGGGRGMRIVQSEDEIASAFERCQAEATAAFGSGQLYVERFLPSVRHIEVQIVGDGTEVIHLWERDCSIQRRNQKLIELAPAPNLNPVIREKLLDAAVTLGRATGYRGLGTVEFLVALNDAGEACEFFFIETNPRIQVEHTITEEVTGLDLVAIQLQLASGESLESMGLTQQRITGPNGFALQARINTETLNDQGELVPTGGTLQQFQMPGGPGIRVDTYGYPGYCTNPHFDSLLAKLIVHSRTDSLGQLLTKAGRALSEVHISGIDVNLGFLRQLLQLPELQTWNLSVRAVEAQIKTLLSRASDSGKNRYIDAGEQLGQAQETENLVTYDEGVLPVSASLQGVVVAVEVEAGQTVSAGDELAVVEAMKMQHVITAPCAGTVLQILVSTDDMIQSSQPILLLQEAEGVAQVDQKEVQQDLDAIRADMQKLQNRLAPTLDENRPEAVKKRHDRGLRTARENVAALCDQDSFLEYGQLVYAAQRRRKSQAQLQTETPADGIIAGIGSVNADVFAQERSRVAVLSYDATVMAGTQGSFGHKKTDRVLEVAAEQDLPVIFFTEGGGGRPGDTDFGDVAAAGLDLRTFHTMARHKGRAVKIGVNSGFCFAGNAAIFGSCDLKIATRSSWIGMGGPAMIEGGGLGTFGPKDIGPAPMQASIGLIDVLVEDEAQAVAKAKQLFSYLQGSIPADKDQQWDVEDQRILRHLIPEDRKRVYDIRTVITTLADKDSFLELKQDYGMAMITGLIRVAGRPIGLIANNPKHVGGAIDATAADKAAQFLALCNRFKLPVLSLCDTPGFMVGPDNEKAGGVGKSCGLMAAGASLDVPLVMVCLRRGYGLGAMAMAGASFSMTSATVAWPTGEFGPMGLEGGVRLGFKRELEAETDPAARQALFDTLVQQAYEAGSAFSMASFLEIDAVIDPIDTRQWISSRLSSH